MAAADARAIRIGTPGGPETSGTDFRVFISRPLAIVAPMLSSNLRLGFALLLALAAGAHAAPDETKPAAKLAPPTRPEDTPAIEEPAPPAAETPATEETPPAAAPAGPPVHDWLEAQIELARRGFSSGSIDGVGGAQSVSALKAFQLNEGLRDSGTLDKATKQRLLLTAPPLTQYILTTVDTAEVRPVPDTWLGKSKAETLGFGSILELIAERHHASPGLIRRLNPGADWKSPLPGTVYKVPAVGEFTTAAKLVRMHISLSEHVLEGVDNEAHTIFHFPVSIARNVEKRPVGELHVTVVIHNPVYTWDPAVFPESPESREITHRLILPAGPNNPVGLAWLGLDREGYGIHGTPEPENVGRTESHGCFRLANWDAVALADLAWIGLPIDVDP